MTSYTFPTCSKSFATQIQEVKPLSFNQKIDSICNSNNKTSFKEMNERTDELDTLFNSCLNIVRDNEHLVGDNAMKIINYFLILRLIEPCINSGEIDIEKYPFHRG